jgi:hypothetical protein
MIVRQQVSQAEAGSIAKASCQANMPINPTISFLDYALTARHLKDATAVDVFSL